ncbi:hypothetical protein [Gemmobacter nectariphilus]|uniref:hypothetical protein n=1 Tax=Gemmobacter nectariphilus TaxID=220343 RepID=UPI00040856B8|nr:hypothetical protein [Gemmobacter nectariphilus]
MADQNLLDFNKRVTRIRKAHVDGFGFEAVGTLGRSSYRPRRRLRLPVTGPVLVVVSVTVILKAAILAQLGGDHYQSKVDRLWSGNLLEQAGAVLMQPDPLTLWVADRLSPLV